jgi:hypothetical protein
MQTVQKFRFGRTPHSFLHHFDHVHAGWTIMFLDNRSFVPQDTAADALGLCPGDSPSGSNGRHIWDISSTAQSLSETSRRFIKRRSNMRRSHRPSSPSSTTRPTLDRSLALHQDEARSEISDRDGVATVSTDEQTTVASNETSDTEDDSDVSVYSGDMYSEEEGHLADARPRTPIPQCEYSENFCGDLPCPILHASVRNVFLLQPSVHREEGGPPCASPLVSRHARFQSPPNAEDSSLIGELHKRAAARHSSRLCSYQRL